MQTLHVVRTSDLAQQIQNPQAAEAGLHCYRLTAQEWSKGEGHLIPAWCYDVPVVCQRLPWQSYIVVGFTFLGMDSSAQGLPCSASARSGEYFSHVWMIPMKRCAPLITKTGLVCSLDYWNGIGLLRVRTMSLTWQMWYVGSAICLYTELGLFEWFAFVHRWTSNSNSWTMNDWRWGWFGVPIVVGGVNMWNWLGCFLFMKVVGFDLWRWCTGVYLWFKNVKSKWA
jgi:hypothetical protein